LYGDLDARLRKIENTATPTPPADAAAPATPSVADSAAELRSYEAAHELFKTGKYQESEQAFEKLLTDYPNGKYAPNAQYWLGYAYFSQKNYKAAMASQQKLISVYPDHQKVPDAMYNIANSQIQLADVEGARKTLRALLEKFPQSEAAPLARKRLAVLDSIKSK
jgi:tol-pal system protein YbgF